jgi:hypothetical protein
MTPHVSTYLFWQGLIINYHSDSETVLGTFNNCYVILQKDLRGCVDPLNNNVHPRGVTPLTS